MVKKNAFSEFATLIRRNKTFVNYIFLGVGLTLFLINITAFMSFVHTMDYSKFLFNTSVFGSIFIALVAVYNITAKKEK